MHGIKCAMSVECAQIPIHRSIKRYDVERREEEKIAMNCRYKNGMCEKETNTDLPSEEWTQHSFIHTYHWNFMK